MIKVLFFGTAEIAKQALKALYDQPRNFSIVGVVSQVDKVQNRNKEIIFSPVKEFAITHNLKLFQPQKLIDFIEETKNLNPDIILTCAYGKIIPLSILEIPRFGAINIHGSILPKYRGASPIQTAILNQDETSGITLMYMNDKMDEGNIIFKYEINLDPDETTSSLFKKMENLAYEVITNDFIKCCNESVESYKQDDHLASYCTLIKRDDEFVDWNNPIKKVVGKIRCLYEKPLATSKINGLDLKIGLVIPTNQKVVGKPGEIVKMDKTGMYVNTKDYLLNIQSIKIPGKKMQEIKQIINGKLPFKVGDYFCK